MQIPNKSEQQYRRMVETPIPKLVTSLAIPTTITTLITVLYNTADTFFVSQIHESASAAVGVVYSIMAIIQAVGYGLGMGAGTLISRRLGEKKDAEASTYGASAFAAAIFFGLLVGVIVLSVLTPFLRLIGASDTMLPYALPYARIILIGAPISCSTFVLSNILRAEGDAKFSMVGMTGGGILNIVLDPLFIFGLDMGSGGAALATVLSQLVSFLVLLSAFLRKRTIIKLHPKNISLRIGDYGRIVSTGLPTVFRQSLGSVSATALNVTAVVYGDAVVAAVTIANKVYVLVRNLIMGLGQGFQPVAGYNYGAGNKKRTYQSFVFVVLVGTGICLIAGIFSYVYAEPIMWWFCDSAEVARVGTQTLRIAALVMPLLAFSTFTNQLFQCLGFRTIATLLAGCRQGFFFLPLIVLLPKWFDCLGVQMTQPVADLMTFLASIPLLIWFCKKKLKV